ncbi:hypothetical protein EAH80_19405 [Mycobacterium hodleri]|uniref:DUF4386 domain-containing protein n=2 Tax=Mycolicibacterium hodleri TaxID=49897 RepID=A0A502E7Z5_9MYCO|nr:hypothetical protein EAH80_19405 [Mycolicibacterium hodleri]
MEAKVQRVLIWSGLGMIVVWLGAFLFIAGFIPPSAPTSSSDAIVRLYEDHSIAIKLGLVMSMLGSALLVPFGVAISGQLKRIDGAKALADIQMVSCALLSLEFITPIGVWMATSFRVDGRSPEFTEAMHDLGWILFMTVIWSLWVQLIAIAVAIFVDRREEPVLPRWLGYLSLWTSVLILPAGTVLFFKSGLFAWNGVAGLYIPLVGFVIWITSMSVVIHRNLTKRIGEGIAAGKRSARPPLRVGSRCH